MGNRLYGVVLRTPDRHALRDFYEKAFGVQFQEHSDHGPIHYAAQFGEGLIEIYTSSSKNNDSPIIGVDSIAQVLQKIPESSVHRQPTQTDQGLMAIIRDTDGRLVLLMQDSD